MLTTVELYKKMDIMYNGMKVKQEKAARLWVTARVKCLLAIVLNTVALQYLLDLFFAFGLPTPGAALALPNVVVSRLPGVPILALPGGQRPGIGNFRTKPLETTILSQPAKIFRLSRYAMRTTFSFCSMKHRLPDVPIFALPGGFGVATKNFRTKPFETTILGYLVVIFRLKILAFWAALPVLDIAISGLPNVPTPALPSGLFTSGRNLWTEPFETMIRGYLMVPIRENSSFCHSTFVSKMISETGIIPQNGAFS